MSIHQDIVVWLYQMLSHWTLGLLIAFGIGIGAVPLAIYFRLLPGKAMKTIVTRIMWTVGALSLGGDAYVLDHRKSGQYEAQPVVKKDGTYYVVRDGDPVELDTDADPNAWSRLGWHRFGITYEKDEESLAALAPEIEVEEAAADGGIVMTGVERGGYPEVIEPVENGYAVSMSRVDTQLEGAGGPEQAFVAGEQALKNHGGDDAGMGNIALVIATLFSTIFGAIMAYVMMGM